MPSENARARRRIDARGAAREAVAQIHELTGRKTLAVASLEPTDDGWLVGVEVLEDARVPSSGDMLALYEAEIGNDGDLVAYRRAQRYRRSDTRNADADAGA